MTIVLFVLPDSTQPDYTWARIRRLSDEYFPAPKYDKIYAARRGAAAFAAPAFGETAIEFDRSLYSKAQIVVAAEEVFDTLEIPADLRQYALEHRQWHVFIRLRNQSIDSRDYSHIDTHAYNRNAGKTGVDHLQFFPYGYLFRECGIGGPLDEFGFRIASDPSGLAERPPDHKLIVVLGGSAVWSYFNFYDESFPVLLQEAIQTAWASQGRPHKVSVLNFGQGYAVVLNEILTYLLHAERLRPDLVISHDGPNDILLSLSSEPFLLSRDICAPYYMEAWSQKLHDRADVPPRVPPGTPVRVNNMPRNVIRAYLNRKLQLDRVVRASGAKHLLALQPYAKSKKSSKQEEWNLQDQRYVWLWAELYEKFPAVFEQLSHQFGTLSGHAIIDFHRAFGAIGPDETLFQDFVHTVPLGEKYIAEAYANHILQNSLI